MLLRGGRCSGRGERAARTLVRHIQSTARAFARYFVDPFAPSSRRNLTGSFAICLRDQSRLRRRSAANFAASSRDGPCPSFVYCSFAHALNASASCVVPARRFSVLRFVGDAGLSEVRNATANSV